MTDDRGLSIFDEGNTEADEPTQVIPRVEADEPKPATAEVPAQKTAPQTAPQTAAQVAAQTAQKPAQAASQAAPVVKVAEPLKQAEPVATAVPRSANAPLVPPKAASTSAAALPLVRRGGYDKDAVDRHLRTTSAEKAGLIASLNESQDKLRALQAENAQLREKTAEIDTPSYAGLGGR